MSQGEDRSARDFFGSLSLLDSPHCSVAFHMIWVKDFDTVLDWMDMSSSKGIVVVFVCLLLIIMIYWYRQPTSPLPLPAYSSSPKTCLDTNDASAPRQSLFHLSMVHFTVPSTLSYWVQNKTGFEIGAPSLTTWGHLGVYDSSRSIDVTNFASNTLWESGLSEGAPFTWKDLPKGKQFIREAVNLHGIPDGQYDFVCASDVLEHIANPIKALLEWIRILRPGGLLLIIVPFKNVTFDHKRNITSLEHLILDYRQQTTEDDKTHFDEILRLHDLTKDAAAGNFDEFKARSEKNFQHRGLHQHVFNQELLYHLFICLNLEIKVQFTWDYHNLIIGQKR